MLRSNHLLSIGFDKFLLYLNHLQLSSVAIGALERYEEASKSPCLGGHTLRLKSSSSLSLFPSVPSLSFLEQKGTKETKKACK